MLVKGKMPFFFKNKNLQKRKEKKIIFIFLKTAIVDKNMLEGNDKPYFYLYFILQQRRQEEETLIMFGMKNSRDYCFEDEQNIKFNLKTIIIILN